MRYITHEESVVLWRQNLFGACTIWAKEDCKVPDCKKFLHPKQIKDFFLLQKQKSNKNNYNFFYASLKMWYSGWSLFNSLYLVKNLNENRLWDNDVITRDIFQSFLQFCLTNMHSLKSFDIYFRPWPNEMFTLEKSILILL